MQPGSSEEHADNRFSVKVINTPDKMGTFNTLYLLLQAC
jgi:hypothetical protein